MTLRRAVPTILAGAIPTTSVGADSRPMVLAYVPNGIDHSSFAE